MVRSFVSRALVPVVAIAVSGACAANGKDDGAAPDTGNGSGASSGAGTFGGDGRNAGDAAVDGKGTRAQRCDASGRCTCFNIASIGRPGHTGFGNGNDSTTAFTDWLGTQSSANVALVTERPALTPAFLAKYDVLILQWLVDGVSGSTGAGYWTFTGDEVQALQAWVIAGGGLVTLSGYDASAQEVTPLNQLLRGVSDLSYGTSDVLGAAGGANYCLGDSEPLGGWVQSTPLAQHIDEVGAFHGRPLQVGPRATVDCRDNQNVYAAHEDVGHGHVFAYADEWVTYTSQWFGVDAGAQCADASADVIYQVPQFWFNAITYASQATACPFTLMGPIAR